MPSALQAGPLRSVDLRLSPGPSTAQRAYHTRPAFGFQPPHSLLALSAHSPLFYGRSIVFSNSRLVAVELKGHKRPPFTAYNSVILVLRRVAQPSPPSEGSRDRCAVEKLPDPARPQPPAPDTALVFRKMCCGNRRPSAGTEQLPPLGLTLLIRKMGMIVVPHSPPHRPCYYHEETCDKEHTVLRTGPGAHSPRRTAFVFKSATEESDPQHCRAM